jgi:hypothetical protein
MPDETDDTFSDVHDLRLRRHAILSTALPYPKRNWSDKGCDKENLAHLRDYCESLANSTLDWYLNHHRVKKHRAQFVHSLIYFFSFLAAIATLAKIAFGNISTGTFFDFLNSHAGEIALGFIGLAGTGKLLDASLGYTADWMRFITTAARISQELAKFEFDWAKIELTRRRDPAPPAATPGNADQNSDEQDPKPPPAGTPKFEVCPSCGNCYPAVTDPTERLIKLADEFCTKIFNIVGAEISVWADELKKRVDRMAHQSASDK